MALSLGVIFKPVDVSKQTLNIVTRGFRLSTPCQKVTSGRYKVTSKQNKPLTYEQANPPHFIGVRKAWNSWNTSNLYESTRQSETAVEDFFIRKFIFGTWHRLFMSEVIIKRRANAVYIGGIINQTIHPRKMYFLIGYTEELLGNFLKCPVKMELQSVTDKKDVIFKYI